MMCDTDKNHLLNNLKVFVDEQKTWFRNVLDSVGWNISDLETLIQTDEPTLVPCSINPEHRVPHESLLSHENRCEKINGEYPEITDVPEEVTIDVKDSTHSITDCDDGSNDNLDTIDKTGKNRSEEKGKSTCLVELLAAERDAKRRRAAHRGKRVHSNKKSYVEVLREVISGQMETLNDGSITEPDFERTDAESVQKTIIQPHVDSYLGVGSKCFSGNPFKRWMNIEKEEQELIKEIRSGKNEKHSDHDRNRERSREKYKNVGKSTYDNYAKDHHKHREHFRDDRHRDVYKSGDHQEYHSSRNHERSFSSYYDYENHLRKKIDNDHLRKELENDHSTDLHEPSGRREKKREKKSRDRSNDSHDRSDKHKKKRKKKSRERSIHKKKHRKSKHHDSETEQC